MNSVQGSIVSIPFPSQWGIHASIGGRPVVWGTLNINSVTGNRVEGTVNFRGTPIPISGFWNANTRQINFNSPYATYSGTLTFTDDPTIRVRHFILNGQITMKPPSLQAGESGTWIATTNTVLHGNPVKSDTLPPVGAFLTSDLLNQQYQNSREYHVWGWRPYPFY